MAGLPEHDKACVIDNEGHKERMSSHMHFLVQQSECWHCIPQYLAVEAAACS